jgi:integrator complex subunit 11
MVVFATPGMLHAGLSLQLFKKWAPFEQNMVIMPGYCVAGTVGHKILGGAKKVEFENKHVLDVKMAVEYMSFSAHADAKGIMQLISQCEPQNVLLVHGEAKKMEFLQGKIKTEFGINCFMPRNGETVNIPVTISIPVDISIDLFKNSLYSGPISTDSKKPRLLHGAVMMQSNPNDSSNTKITIVDSEQAMNEIGIKPHVIRFTNSVKLQDLTRKPVLTVSQIILSKVRSKFKENLITITPEGLISISSVQISVKAYDDIKEVFVSWNDEDETLGTFVLQMIYEIQHLLVA